MLSCGTFISSLITIALYTLSFGNCLKSNDYDHITYTQQWPQGVCECTNDIEEKMKIFWPKLVFASKISKLLISKAVAVSGSRISFWEHEWEKHGTCCTDLSILNSEHKYFSTGLDLNRKYDLLSWLSDKGIVPSKTKTYQLADIRNAVMSNVKTKPYIHCCKTNGKQRIQELMICLDKQLKPIDCVEDDEDCTDDVPVSYEPIVPY